MGKWRTLFGSSTDAGTPEEPRFPVSNIETHDHRCWVSTGLFPQVVIMGSEKGDMQNLQQISISSGDSARALSSRADAVSAISASDSRAATEAPGAVACAVRRLQVAVCKEQSPSSREDGWELVEEVEMDAGPQQNENLSVNTEARFVKFTILAGCV